jgi:mannose-1-phosphate guanylyltransferase
MINAGAWFVEADVLSRIPENISFSFERNVFPQLLADGQPVYAFGSSGYWIDMGTTEKYLQIHRDLLSGKCRRYRLPVSDKPVVGKGSRIDRTTRIIGRLIIGPGCTIRARVRIDGPVVIRAGCLLEEGSMLTDSVIWSNVHIGRGVSVTSSIIADNCVLAEGCVVEGSVLGDGVTVGPGVKVTTGSKLDPGTKVGPLV